MDELIEFIAKSVVDDPSAVSVSSSPRGGEIRVELSVADEDMGRIIGRRGRFANAMRSLLRVAASQEGTRANLEIK